MTDSVETSTAGGTYMPVGMVYVASAGQTCGDNDQAAWFEVLYTKQAETEPTSYCTCYYLLTVNDSLGDVSCVIFNLVVAGWCGSL